MDLIGTIGAIDNRPSGRNPNKGNDKPVRPKAHPDPAHDHPDQAHNDHFSAEPQDTLLGKNVDTTA